MLQTIRDLRLKIINFKQTNGNELFHEAWDRYKGYITECPHHHLDRELIIRFFYAGLFEDCQFMVDTAAGGNIDNKTPYEVYDILESVSENSQQTIFHRRAAVLEEDHGTLKELAELKRQVAELKRQRQVTELKRQVALLQVKPPPVEICWICKEYVDGKPRTRNYPSFLWSESSAPPPRENNFQQRQSIYAPQQQQSRQGNFQNRHPFQSLVPQGQAHYNNNFQGQNNYHSLPPPPEPTLASLTEAIRDINITIQQNHRDINERVEKLEVQMAQLARMVAEPAPTSSSH